MKGTIEEIKIDYAERTTKILLNIHDAISMNQLEKLNNLKAEELDIEIKKHREKRIWSMFKTAWAF